MERGALAETLLTLPLALKIKLIQFFPPESRCHSSLPNPHQSPRFGGTFSVRLRDSHLSIHLSTHPAFYLKQDRETLCDNILGN